ncbi:MAG: ribosome silencing factor [Rhodobacteraceae bacterium]|nr:MAG: ribosome silencing factor [Paracoccaceae bacterium]
MTANSANTTLGKSGDKSESDAMLARILKLLDESKAEDIVTIPLQGKSEMADNMVIASGRSSRQVSALAEQLYRLIKEETGIICRTEGKQSGDWVLLDCGDAVVHIFRPEVRDFYQLEKMWLTAGGDQPEED